MFSYANVAPVCASARSTYVPGLENVTLYIHLLPGGTGGACHPGAQGEPPRWSSHTLKGIGGSNVTASAAPRVLSAEIAARSAGPRYTSQASRRPGAVLRMKSPPTLPGPISPGLRAGASPRPRPPPPRPPRPGATKSSVATATSGVG